MTTREAVLGDECKEGLVSAHESRDEGSVVRSVHGGGNEVFEVSRFLDLRQALGEGSARDSDGDFLGDLTNAVDVRIEHASGALFHGQRVGESEASLVEHVVADATGTNEVGSETQGGENVHVVAL